MTAKLHVKYNTISKKSQPNFQCAAACFNRWCLAALTFKGLLVALWQTLQGMLGTFQQTCLARYFRLRHFTRRSHLTLLAILVWLVKSGKQILGQTPASLDLRT